MASAPYDDSSGPYGRERDDDPREHSLGDHSARERSLGEHVFIWIAWALAAGFWGASMTMFIGILRDAGQAVAAPDAPGAPGGMGYLAFVVIAFLVVAGALAYASLRTARMGGLEARSQAATADLYDRIERDGGRG
jgi:hypothetical protein